MSNHRQPRPLMILTAEERAVCLEDSAKRERTIEELGEEWRRTRRVADLMAWSDAVGREARRLSAEIAGLARRQADAFRG